MTDGERLELEQLRAENARQKKMIEVLVNRVEQNHCHTIEPYAAFQHSVILADQVRQKTEALNATLLDLEQLNTQLSQAKLNAEAAHQRFLDAIESISDGFALYDRTLRLVHCNYRFRKFWLDANIDLSQQPITLKEIKALAQQKGLIIRELPLQHPNEGRVFQQNNDRWVQVSERPTADGGLVMLYTDITVLKQAESERHQAEFHRKLKKSYVTLEKRFEQRATELQNLNNQLNAEINERERIQNRLLEAKREAEQANESKTKFLAAISHDLLQPLNAAQLFIGSLEAKVTDTETQQIVHALSTSVTDVVSLIASLVDISKLDAGAIIPDKQPFMLGELLSNLANEFHEQASANSLKFRYVPISAMVHSDSLLIARVVRNLVNNAIRYTPKGKVLLGCRRTSMGVRIDVYDTGVGIPEDKQTVIFQEFKRLDARPSFKGTSLGLGLAIVEKIGRVLEHPITLHSSIGKGSRFSITLPYAEAQPLMDTPTANVILNQNVFFGKHVLVVDNDEAICRGMHALLSEWGCHVYTYTSLKRLPTHFSSTQPLDLLIVDYHLDGDEDGLSAAHFLQQQYSSTFPIMVISADRSDKLLAAVRQKQFLLLNKPTSPVKLKATLGYLLTT
ncbi:sensory box histidine kinase/response regulator [Vibrio sp. RC586]|uniref:NahK/ErcS family hybrid sensor histidine kinase/response regulator n=1 Tax=Vibrio sp. RC586 TaxID=675815 RepID=UPI0001BB8204|nr:NahK/ErcS family hybrid sensor histidine kinase/response regulator [Vibrio sp. RC586]EEY98141.1 sensory box histidine kinase/response regulator [Vibrio sp. RC586]